MLDDEDDEDNMTDLANSAVVFITYPLQPTSWVSPSDEPPFACSPPVLCPLGCLASYMFLLP